MDVPGVGGPGPAASFSNRGYSRLTSTTALSEEQRGFLVGREIPAVFDHRNAEAHLMRQQLEQAAGDGAKLQEALFTNALPSWRKWLIAVFGVVGAVLAILAAVL